MKKRDVDVDSDFLLWEYSDVGFIDDDCNPPPSTPHSLPNNESPWNSPSGDSPAFCHHFDEEPVSSEKFRGDTGGHKVRFAADLQTNLYSDSTNGYREEEVYIQEYEFTSDSDSSFGENDGTVQYGTFSPDDVEIPISPGTAPMSMTLVAWRTRRETRRNIISSMLPILAIAFCVADLLSLC